MEHLSSEEFLNVVFKVAKEQARGAGNHPQDIMSSVLTTVEVIYALTDALPVGVSIGRTVTKSVQ